MLRDLRYALRVLASKPVFTFVAALSLALGIGANSAIFSLVDGIWFRPLAVSHPGEIVRLFSATNQDREGRLSYAEYLDFKRQASALQDVFAIGGRGAILAQGDRHDLLTLNLVSSNFFTGLGIKPEVGRVFTPQDEAANPGALVVVLGNSAWKREFGGDPAIVGKQIRIERAHDVLVTVIGVLPESFRGIEASGDRDLWFPHQTWSQLGDVTELERRGDRWFHVLGRLAPGASVKTARAQITAIAQRMAAAYPATNRGRRATLISDLDYRIEQAGANGLALLAIVLLVVLISSVNVANLLLARGGARGREMAVRLALGSDRFRLVRQLMAENLLLGALGLGLGLLIGAALIAILPSLIPQPPGLHSSVDFRFDARVLAFSIVVSFATVLLFGLVPAWRSTRPDLVPALKGETGSSPGRRWPMRNWLVVAQVGVSLALLACAGVLVRSFANTQTKDLGFARHQLLLVWLDADGAKPSLYRDVMSHYRAMPGVLDVAAAVRAPLSLSSNGIFQRVTFPARPEYASAPPFEIKYNAVTPNFLRVMGTPVLRGRGFEERDDAPGAHSVLVNEAMAQRFWPGRDPIDQTVRLRAEMSAAGVQGTLYRVIGVVKNAPINEVGEPPEPYLYLDYWSNFEEEVTFLVQTRGEAGGLAQAARSTLKAVDSRLDPLSITTENALIRFSAFKYQVTAELAGVLGALGLMLTAVGLYGVVSYGVGQRTREVGIRMALGAGRRETLRLVLGEVGLLGLAGVAFGLPLALVATRSLAALLFGIGPWDAPTFVAAAVMLAVILFAAGYVPARRATRIDPAVCLRAL